MKAAPTAAILRIFNEEGLGIDASSVHEVERAVRAGYGTESISLSTQELADDFIYWAQDGIKINLCSINQIHKIGKWGKARRVGLVSTQAKDRVEIIEPMWEGSKQFWNLEG